MFKMDQAGFSAPIVSARHAPSRLAPAPVHAHAPAVKPKPKAIPHAPASEAKAAPGPSEQDDWKEF